MVMLRPIRWARELELNKPFSSPFSTLQTEMNRLMESFLSDAETPAPSEIGFMPSLDVAEEDKGFRVSVELPGMAEGDVDVSFEKNTLRIKGEKKAEHEEKGKNFTRIERSYGSFYRSIPFSTDIDDAKIDAHFDKGVLHVWLPKAASALKEAKKIQIKASK